MAITEVLRALGGWGMEFSDTMPQELWNSIEYFGHVAVHLGQVDCRVAGDSLLGSARYVGVVRKKDGKETRTLGGPGMGMWLGDEDGKGPVIENLLTITSQTFPDSVRMIVPPASSSILEGSYFTVPGGPFTGTFQWQTQREALNYLCDTMNAEWKVLGNGTLNAGPSGLLFITTPRTLVVRKASGFDLGLVGFSGEMGTEQDVNDFTTRVVMLVDDGTGGGGVASADADINPGLNPYKDIHGTSIRMTRLIQESGTDFTNADARAQLQLNRFSGTRDALELSTAHYDVKGDVEVGDYIWVYDPVLDLVDNLNEVQFRGQRLNPMKLRLNEMTWPVTKSMSVGYRDGNGKWFDLTPFLIPEQGDTTLVVGGYNRSLSDGANGGVATGPINQPNTTIPAEPTWITPFDQLVYQSDINDETKAQTRLRWNAPLNTDGSAVSDGDYYEIRFRTSTAPIFPVTHAQMAAYTNQQLHDNGGTFGQPIAYPITDWQYQRVPSAQLSVMLYELTANMPYEAQIRLVDNGTPANAGAWSLLTSWQTGADTIAPSTPAAPEVATSLIAVQITHKLGAAGVGDFSLERDMHHLEIHGGTVSSFTPDNTTRLGRLTANWGMIQGTVPAVGTFPIKETIPIFFKVIAVDTFGNKSGPSPSAVASATLIDNAHISDLTVSKVTAGTMSAFWIMAGSFATGAPGVYPRVGFDNVGFYAFDSTGNYTFTVDALTGDVFTVGSFSSGLVGQRVEINPTATYVPEIWFSNGISGRHAYINSLDNGGENIVLGLNSGPSTVTGFQSTILLAPTFWMMAYNTIGGSEKRGSYLEGTADYVKMGSRNDPAGNLDASYQIDTMFGGSSGGSHWLVGRFGKTNTFGGYSALYVDQVSGSGTSATITYGATMQSVPLPFVEIQGTSGAPPTASSHAVTARGSTSFSIQYPAGNCDIFVWAVRYG